MRHPTCGSRLPEEVAIVGAGPYGLSLAAHLRVAGVPFRIFGRPMQMWRERMPRLMHLKSEPFATDIYDPDGTFPLSRFCRENGIVYRPIGQPISLDTFCSYGAEFQRRFVPDIDTRDVTRVTRIAGGFELEIDRLETARFRSVVLAVGISYFAHVPDEFTRLPPELLSHSTGNGDLARFANKRVAVIGGGSSAIDCAVMLAAVGAEAHLVTRRDHLAFHAPPGPRAWRHRLRAPMSAVGPGWKGMLCTRLPGLFRRMPAGFRFEVTRRFLGPAPCWFTREAFEREVTLHGAARDLSLSAQGGTVSLAFTRANVSTTLAVDHVIAATGFRSDLRRLSFVDPGLLDAVRQARQTPVLDGNFQSSVPGLFFVGVSAANTFGPMLRFACGARYAARRVTKQLVRRAQPSRWAAARRLGPPPAGRSSLFPAMTR